MQLYRDHVVKDRFRCAAGSVDEKTLGKIFGVFEFVVRVVVISEQDLFLSILDGCLAKAVGDGLISDATARELLKNVRCSFGRAINLQFEDDQSSVAIPASQSAPMPAVSTTSIQQVAA